MKGRTCAWCNKPGGTCQDRAEVAALLAKLEDLASQSTTIGERLREMGESEQEKFENMPEGLQQGEQGQAIETAANALDEAASACDEANVGEAVSALQQMEL